jgi:hypothetical protein
MDQRTDYFLGESSAAWEADWVSWLCYPTHPVWTRVMDAVQAVSLQAGQDCFIS